MPGAADERPAAAGPADRRGGPRNLVVLLLDSLNRHMLGCYGGAEFATPHLDRFARERAVRFTSHVTGSLPCMPARHDILCGALDFLWRPWGSIEIWEEPVTQQLRRAGVTTMLVSDHPHLFETGGENYHTDFSAWDYVRGHEGDPWRTYSDPSYIGTPALPARGGGWYWQERLGFDSGDRGYDRSRTFFRSEEDFPGPRTMRTAADWVRRGAPDDTPFLLVRRRVRPARAVRHACAVSRPLRPRLGRRAVDLAALRRRCGRVGAVARARGPPDPRQLRIQAHHDRPLGRRGLRRPGGAGAVGVDGGHRVHGPRPLSRREGHLGQARRHAVRAARAHSVARVVAGRGRWRDVRRVDDQRRHPCDDRFRVRCDAAGDGARDVAGAVGDGDGYGGRSAPHRFGNGPSVACSATGCR